MISKSSSVTLFTGDEVFQTYCLDGANLLAHRGSQDGAAGGVTFIWGSASWPSGHRADGRRLILACFHINLRLRPLHRFLGLDRIAMSPVDAWIGSFSATGCKFFGRNHDKGPPIGNFVPRGEFQNLL